MKFIKRDIIVHSDRKPAGNSSYPKVAVQWLNQALCFYQSFCLVDIEVFQNRHLRVAAKRYVQPAGHSGGQKNFDIKMRKQRGLKRYYKNLQTKNDNWSGLNFTDPDKAWFDLWHTHFDWRGCGNDSFKKRKPHLDKLFRHFDLLTEKAKSLKTDYQIWATLLDFDSYSDALFLHTPNPNQDNFPYRIKDLSTKNNLTNKGLAEYVNNLSGYKILFGQADENYCVIYKDKVGVSVT